MAKVINVRITPVRLPLKRPMVASAMTFRHRDFLLVELECDDGSRGIGFSYIGTGGARAAAIAANELLVPVLMGGEADDIGALWDTMYRAVLLQGRAGLVMNGISAIDIALWDLKGKSLGMPVYRLIGGPTQKTMPAYASMLGYATTDMGLVRERAIEMKERGFRAQKWFFRHGPMSGPEGFKLNVDLARTLRETLGPDDDIMLDAWQSWDYNYAVKMCTRLEEYEPRWLEEVGMADRIDTYRRVKESTTIPISGVEHEYTRWGFKRFIDAGALDVLQPDIYWAGGITETVKIASYASVHDLQCIPHGHSSQANAHFSCAMVPTLTPIQEYLVKWNAVHQFFLQDPIVPRDGVIHVSLEPGMGMELDGDKIESEELLEF